MVLVYFYLDTYARPQIIKKIEQDGADLEYSFLLKSLSPGKRMPRDRIVDFW